MKELQEIEQALKQPLPRKAEDIEAFRLRYVSKKSVFRNLFNQLNQGTAEEKRILGPQLQALKAQAYHTFKQALKQINNSEKPAPAQDLTLPPQTLPLGARHLLKTTQHTIENIFRQQGFGIAQGPEIESSENNFEALNFPEDHPARDMQDTFFLSQDKQQLLRTHTSAAQTRLMKQHPPPIKYIVPGRVYRNETITARSHCFFHQIEGICIDKNISFGHLKHTLATFTKTFFGTQTKTRLRPSYFPFTEPSAEMDISCLLCQQKGCTLCKHTGWLEVMGCGMIHPNVLTYAGMNAQKYTGYAFGLGIERIVMLKHQIQDIRTLSQNDIRFLRQFEHAAES